MAPKPRCWLASEFVLRMRRQTGIVHALHLGMLLEIARDCHAVGIVLGHAHGQRLDAARDEEAIHGREARAGGALQEIDLLRVGRAREDHGAAEGVAMAIEILGHGVHHDVRAELDGALQIGAEEGVVHGDGDAALVGDGGNRRRYR